MSRNQMTSRLRFVAADHRDKNGTKSDILKHLQIKIPRLKLQLFNRLAVITV